MSETREDRFIEPWLPHRLRVEPGDTVFFEVDAADRMTLEQRDMMLKDLRDKLPDGVNAAITNGVRPHHIERTERRAALRGAVFALTGAMLGIVLTGVLWGVLL